MQQKAFDKVIAGVYDGVLLVLEHNPAFTIGASGGFENFLIPKEELEKAEVDIVETKRGGNITFHGPGQIVAYPIFSLEKLKKDAHWYINCLEEVVIETLSDYGIHGYRKPEYRGVWVGNDKISALGVHLKKWTTFHGLSLNVHMDKEYFNMINPCGITEFGVSNLSDYDASIEINQVKELLVRNFQKVFKIELENADESILE